MTIEIDLKTGPFNTKYAPLAALAVYYQAQEMLKPLQTVQSESGKADVSLADKLIQVLISMLAGCEYISEVNSQLRGEPDLARAWGFERFLEQSTLAIALNRLNRTNLDQLEQAIHRIWHKHGHTLRHDWRGLLRFDLDLSGLPSGKGAEWSEKGYFSGKKRPLDVN